MVFMQKTYVQGNYEKDQNDKKSLLCLSTFTTKMINRASTSDCG